MTEPLANLNGRLLPFSQAALSFNDIGLVWGATITDLCRTVRHRLYRWPEHCARFRRNCARIGLELPLTDTELTARAEQLIQHNTSLIPAGSDLSLLLFATPGTLGYYLGQEGFGPPTVALHTFPIPFHRYAALFERGARLRVPSVRQVAAASVDPQIKQRSRLHWWLAEQEVHRSDPGASALLLDEHGHVTETAAASLLVVRNGTVWTPRRAAILDGISLGVCVEGCRALGLPWAEADLTVADVQQADEVLLTSSNFCLAGVSAFNGTPLAWPGPVYERLLGWWSDSLGLDVRAQILQGRELPLKNTRAP